MRKLAAIAALAIALVTATGANAAVNGNSGNHFHKGWGHSFSDGH
jgi:Spy/CpxP family protein refolding chaperone